MSRYTSTKDIAKEIRNTIKIKGVKLSVTKDHNSIYVRLMEAPFEATTDGDNYKQLNQYYYLESDTVTKEAKTIFQLVQEIIDKYHWDDSDSMTDYFSCAFYYNYHIGRWDKDFINTLKN